MNVQYSIAILGVAATRWQDGAQEGRRRGNRSTPGGRQDEKSPRAEDRAGALGALSGGAAGAAPEGSRPYFRPAPIALDSEAVGSSPENSQKNAPPKPLDFT